MRLRLRDRVSDNHIQGISAHEGYKVSYVLSYYGKPLACGDYESLRVMAEGQQRTRVNSYGMTWSSTKQGHKLLIIQRDADLAPYTSFGGYEMVEVPMVVDDTHPETDSGVLHVR